MNLLNNLKADQFLFSLDHHFYCESDMYDYYIHMPATTTTAAAATAKQITMRTALNHW